MNASELSVGNLPKQSKEVASVCETNDNAITSELSVGSAPRGSEGTAPVCETNETRDMCEKINTRQEDRPGTLRSASQTSKNAAANANSTAKTSSSGCSADESEYCAEPDPARRNSVGSVSPRSAADIQSKPPLRRPLVDVPPMKQNIAPNQIPLEETALEASRQGQKPTLNASTSMSLKEDLTSVRSWGTCHAANAQNGLHDRDCHKGEHMMNQGQFRHQSNALVPLTVALAFVFLTILLMVIIVIVLKHA